jgi:hypothetical protein
MFNIGLRKKVKQLEKEVWELKNPQKFKLLEKVKVVFSEGNSAIMTVVSWDIEGDGLYGMVRKYNLADSNLDIYTVYEYSIEPCGTN